MFSDLGIGELVLTYVAILGFGIVCVAIGYALGFARGRNAHKVALMKAMIDQGMWGSSFTVGGNRIDPAHVFRVPDDVR